LAAFVLFMAFLILLSFSFSSSRVVLHVRDLSFRSGIKKRPDM